MTTMAMLLRRGRTYDYEDYRTTYRLQTSRSVLSGLGIEPTITHNEQQKHWDRATNREVHSCTLEGAGGTCKIEWPEWVTDEMFDAAYALADKAISERTTYNRNH